MPCESTCATSDNKLLGWDLCQTNSFKFHILVVDVSVKCDCNLIYVRMFSSNKCHLVLQIAYHVFLNNLRTQENGEDSS